MGQSVVLPFQLDDYQQQQKNNVTRLWFNNLLTDRKLTKRFFYPFLPRWDGSKSKNLAFSS